MDTDVEELLGLPATTWFIEFRAVLALALQQACKRQKLTQENAAKRIGTSPAQVARMEAGQSSITIDRLIEGAHRTGRQSSDDPRGP